MKTIRIIDLLNKIANGEEVPKKVKYEDEKFVFSDKTHQYYVGDNSNDINTYYDNSLKKRLYNFICLNDEVEIIEEDKKIEKLENEIEFYSYSKYKELKNEVDKVLYILKAINLVENKISNLNNKINELIDEVNRLKKEE